MKKWIKHKKSQIDTEQADIDQENIDNITDEVNGVDVANVESGEVEAKAEKKRITLDKTIKIVPMVVMGIGVLIMLLQWILGLNLMAILGAVYMCVLSVVILLGMIVKRKIYLWYLIGYICVSFGIMSFYIVAGADAGFGAFISCSEGFASSAHAFWQGEGNFGTRLLGNLLLCSPALLLIIGLYVMVDRWKGGSVALKNGFAYTLTVLLMIMSVVFVFTMNLRAKPRVFDMQKGHDEYLGNINKNANGDRQKNPNVLVILMDDMGYGDTSFNAKKAGRTPSFETPNIDSIAENGVDVTNFYSNYSVCSPSRFACMTGRYPYRGYADNVIYPTVNSPMPFNETRYFNSIEMGANCDGMLGDEVTMAEMFKAAGYNTGAFGKWHLGDYGEYLPTNQGFDYFYGSHHINDNTTYYHVREGGDLGQGNYEVVKGTDIDQSENTVLIHNEINAWVKDKAHDENPFFAYYASPWPHGPVHAGYEYQGTSGAGIYGDCLEEFDHYLGVLFDTMKEEGIFDDTIIMFTSDNGPALQGSTNELRGAKYSAYEAGQKLPFYMEWGNAPSEYVMLQNDNDPSTQNTIEASMCMTDIFPTLANMCNITSKSGKVGYLPSDVDREMDGLSAVPLLKADPKTPYIHGVNMPILHMNREKIQGIQYTVPTEQVLKSVEGYTQGVDHKHQTGNAADYANMPFIKDNEWLNWKYFKNMANDNATFAHLRRKDWLICLTDDTSESYQRADLFPDLADQYAKTMDEWTKKLHDNRRGINKGYYNKK